MTGDSYFTILDLMTRDSYFTILAEVFMNHILAGNIFHKLYRVNRMQYYGLKTYKQIENSNGFLVLI